tara:strand:+ start:151 stop:270 length:120 start_codon:yes stop_codon:yes gene_type:complete
MSCNINEQFLEHHYEQALDKGLSETEALKYAYEMLDLYA